MSWWRVWVKGEWIDVDPFVTVRELKDRYGIAEEEVAWYWNGQDFEQLADEEELCIRDRTFILFEPSDRDEIDLVRAHSRDTGGRTGQGINRVETRQQDDYFMTWENAQRDSSDDRG